MWGEVYNKVLSHFFVVWLHKCTHSHTHKQDLTQSVKEVLSSAERTCILSMLVLVNNAALANLSSSMFPLCVSQRDPDYLKLWLEIFIGSYERCLDVDFEKPLSR